MTSMDSDQEVEIDIPRYFYKYRSFNDDHLKLLQQNELYFPSPNKFDDPYDCRIPIRYDCEAPEDKRYSYWKQFNETHYPQLTPIEIEALTKSTCEAIRTKPDEVRANGVRLSEIFLEHIGVYCVCDDYKNILLWSHYSDAHRGFLVGFDGIYLSISAAQNQPYPIAMYPVRYNHIYPNLNPYSMTLDQLLQGALCTKSDNWLYQHEYRFIWREGANQSLIIGDNIINRVILGCAISSTNKQRIIDILKKRTDHPYLFQSMKTKDSFSLSFKTVRY